MQQSEVTPVTPIKDGNRARPTRQGQIPGTQGKGSSKLHKLHAEFATAKYERWRQGEIMKRLKPELLGLMEHEDVEEISCEIDVDGRTRVVKTETDTVTNLKSKIMPLEDEDE